MTTRYGRWAALLTLFLAAAIGLVPSAASAAPEAQVDLSAGVVGPEQIAQGQTAVYQFQGLTDTSPRPENVRLILRLPAGLTYESSAPGAVSCSTSECPRNTGECTADAARTVVTCTADNAVDIADGHYSYTATVRVGADVEPGTKLTVEAEATSDGTEATPANNKASFTSTVIVGADLGITAIGPAKPVVPGQPVVYTVVVHNYGPATVTKVTVFGSYSGLWYTGGKMTTEGTDCFADPGSLICEADVNLAPGAEVKLRTELPTEAKDEFWGLREQASVRLYDQPDESGFNTKNNRASFPIVFAKKPTGTGSSSGSGTGSGTGSGGSGGADGPGLPITGPASLPLAGAAVLLLLGGTAALVLTRRRGSQA